MAFQNNAELVNQAVVSLADSAPPDWRKIVFYLEFLEDEQIGLRNSFTGIAFGGEKFDIPLDGYELGRSAETFDAIKSLYLDAAQHGDKWAGILLTILGTGQFTCRFYYDKTPLLDRDYDAVDQILSEGMNELPKR